MKKDKGKQKQQKDEGRFETSRSSTCSNIFPSHNHTFDSNEAKQETNGRKEKNEDQGGLRGTQAAFF